MWLWETELWQRGFRRRSERYWRCERRYGLPNNGHLSVYSWSEQALPAGRFLVELTEFHVTFVVGLDHVHFYFHEHDANTWEPAGHTSTLELLRLGQDVRALRCAADATAAAFVEGLGGILYPRPP